MEDIFIFLFLLYSGLDLTFVTRILKELSVNENQEYDSYESLQILKYKTLEKKFLSNS